MLGVRPGELVAGVGGGGGGRGGASIFFCGGL